MSNFNLHFTGRLCSSSTQIKQEFIKHQNELFNNEQKRQREAVGRIEKIVVSYRGTPQDHKLIMNKNISTPFNCAQRKSLILFFKIVLSFA